MSTIGYGDYLPKSIEEKKFVSAILFIGVTVFSLVVNQMVDVLKDFKEIGQGGSMENPRDLGKWIGLLAYINNGIPLDKKLRIKIEDFFEYYWSKDRMRTLKSTADKKIIDELQDTFVQQILMEFLYVDFLYIFKKHFVDEHDEMQEANIYEKTPDHSFERYHLQGQLFRIKK